MYFTVITSLFFVALISAFSAYYIFPSEAWTYRFGTFGGNFPDGYGFWVHLARLLLYSLLFVTVSFWSFPEDFVELFFCSKLARENTYWRRFCLVSTAFLAIAINYHLFNYHLGNNSLTAVKEETLAIADSSSNRNSPGFAIQVEDRIDSMMKGTKLTYLIFLPYSVVVFGVFAPVTGGVMLYRGGKDFNRATSSSFSYRDSPSTWGQGAMDEFFRYRSRMLATLTSYMRFFIVATAIYVFEQVPGSVFNTKKANSEIMLFWWVIFLCPFLVLGVFLAYYDTYARVKYAAPNADEQKKFASQYSPKLFAKEILTENPIVMLTVIINGLALLLSNFFNGVRSAQCA